MRQVPQVVHDLELVHPSDVPTQAPLRGSVPPPDIIAAPSRPTVTQMDFSSIMDQASSPTSSPPANKIAFPPTSSSIILAPTTAYNPFDYQIDDEDEAIKLALQESTAHSNHATLRIASPRITTESKDNVKPPVVAERLSGKSKADCTSGYVSNTCAAPHHCSLS